MRISLLRISLLRFFKTITKIWLMRFYGLFILLVRTKNKNFANAVFFPGPKSSIRREPSVRSNDAKGFKNLAGTSLLSGRNLLSPHPSLE